MRKRFGAWVAFVGVLVFILASAAISYYASEAIATWFEGREDVLDATGRLEMARATARQVDAVTATMKRQGTLLGVLAVFGVFQGVAIIALLVWFVVNERRARQAMDQMLAAERAYSVDELRPVKLSPLSGEVEPWETWEPVELRERG